MEKIEEISNQSKNDFNKQIELKNCLEHLKKEFIIFLGTKKDYLKDFEKFKMPDINANDIDAAKKIIAGTARSMGIEVER